MKNKIFPTLKAAAAAAIFMAALSGCAKDPKPAPTYPDVEKVTVSQQKLTLAIGETATLTATVTPEGVESTEVVWSSDKPAVATVDAATGKVTGVAGGSAVITATSRVGGKSGECTVRVKPENVLDVITDPAFKEYILNEIDAAGDGKLTLEEAAAVESIDLGGGYGKTEVKNLDGIGYFTGLKELDCSYNSLTELDVTENTELTYLNCGYNQLTKLDVTGNTKLTELHCRVNELTQLDVTNNTKLNNLECFFNRLTQLDASKMASPESYVLYCGYQENSNGESQQLTLTLREEQKEHWNSSLASDHLNTGITLAK